MEDFKVRDAKIEAILKGIGAQLKKDMPEGMGFALLMFDYGAEGNLFYIGSAQRGDIVRTMKEFIAKNPNL